MLPGTYREDDSEGVRKDVLMEARIEAENYKSQLQEMNVVLDSIADDREGIWTDDQRAEIRLMQKTMRTLIEQCDEMISDIDEEMQ